MEIKKQNRFVAFCKKFGAYIIAGAVILIVVVAATLVGVLTGKGVTEVETRPLAFASPVLNGSVLKDYDDTKLQYNTTLNKWEPHFAVDLTSDDASVMSVLDGTVLDVYYKYMSGWVVSIAHSDGFVSTYASLDKEIPVKKGDEVKQGDKIGTMSNSGAGEKKSGAHVDFALTLNGREVDPNNYISLQNK